MPTVVAGSGTGSNLDADLLDGSDSTDFAASTHNHDPDHVNISGDTMTGTLNLPADGLVAGTDQLVLSGGNVGIGTISPIDGLHLKDTQNWGSALRLDASGLTGGQWWRIESTSDAHAEGGGKFLIRDTVAPYAFAITSNGNVGIGTTTPANKLDVAGTVSALAFAGDGSGLTNIPAGSLGTTIESAEITDGEIVNADVSATAAIAASKIADGSGSGLDADLLDGQDSTDFAPTAHAHDGADIDTGTVADARIDPLLARDVEIMPTVLAGDGTGSNLDADLLDGSDSTAFAASGHNHDPAYINTAGDTMAGILNLPTDGLVAGADQLVLSGGNVGIGTTSPAEKLHVERAGNTYQRIYSSIAGQQAGLQLRDAGSNGWQLTKMVNNDFGIFDFDVTGGTGWRFLIDNSGNVGIGTTAPASTLDVNGTVTGTDSSGNYGNLGSGSMGVNGYASSAGGYGVYGMSASGYGVYGYGMAGGNPTYGVYGRSHSGIGYGLYGWASNPNNGVNYGVYGKTDSPNGYGVYGEHPGSSHYGLLGSNTYGVFGRDNSVGNFGYIGGASNAVYGEAVTLTGRGVSGNATGSSGRAVEGIATGGSSMGVFGAGGSYDFYAGGVGVNYGPFTGGHEVKLSEGLTSDVKPGMIVSVTGEAQARTTDDDFVSISSTLPTVKLSNEKNDKAVFGVFVAETPLPENHWYEGVAGERFATVNALGEGRVWISSINGNVEAGDYITTTAIPGYGQRQTDDLLHSYTLGKAIESVDWDTVVETVEFNGQVYKVYLIAVVYTSG